MIVCSNHRSVFDPVVLAFAFSRPVFYMAKEELFAHFYGAAGVVLRLLGAFPVRRNSADLASVRSAERILNRGGAVGIFPQGGCVAGYAMSRIKSGAFLLAARTESPILPASVFYGGKPSLFQRVTVRFGPVIAYEELAAAGAADGSFRGCAALVTGRINAMLEEGL